MRDFVINHVKIDTGQTVKRLEPMTEQEAKRYALDHYKDIKISGIDLYVTLYGYYNDEPTRADVVWDLCDNN
jgi:hypothetical protein